jgi:hypothetical protein
MAKYTDGYADYIIHDITIADELAKIGYTRDLSEYEAKAIFAAIMQRLETLQRNIEKHYTEKKVG